jgi:acyl-coenzyme A thioesterase 13
MATEPPPAPDGFTPSRRSSNLLDLLGPLFEREAEGGYRIGLRVDARHSNAKGFCHGAVLALLADVHLGRLCGRSATPPLSLVTAGLTLAYLSPARIGDWLEAVGEVDRVGRTLAHASGLVLANGKPALRAVGTFQVVAVAVEGPAPR